MSKAWLAVIAAFIATTTACAAPSAEEDETSPDESKLVGGQLDTNEAFKTVVLLTDQVRTNNYEAGGCTATKIGRFTFVTAAHCIKRSIPETSMVTMTMAHQRADGRYEGAEFNVGLALHSSTGGTFDKTSQGGIAPEYWVDRADIAVVRAYPSYSRDPNNAEAFLDLIPVSPLDEDAVQPGETLTAVGYGCREGIYKGSTSLPRRQFGTMRTITPAAAKGDFWLPANSKGVDFDKLAARYLFTAGKAMDADAVSLCPGDSGGPVFRKHNGVNHLAGVNAYYTVRSFSGGVAYSNWHTRVDRQSAGDVHTWIRSLLDKPYGS
jgi:V8-like Glu-specific endopeptidase